MPEEYFPLLRARRRRLSALRSMRELARCRAKPRERVKSRFGPRELKSTDVADRHTDPHLELAARAVIEEWAGNDLRKVPRWPLDVTPSRPFGANSFYF